MPKKIFWNWPALLNAGDPHAGGRDRCSFPCCSGGPDDESANFPSPDITAQGAVRVAAVRVADGLADDDKRAAALELSELSTASVIALVGLAFEARIAAGPDVMVVCRGTGCEAGDLLSLAVRNDCRSIISFGVAGGLAPELLPGDCVVASTIVDYPTLRATDRTWSRKLLDAIPDARHGPIVGANSIVSGPAGKHELYAMTGAVAVDMESHLVARFAAAHGLAFAAVRVIIDPAHRLVPPAAMLAMGPSGAADLSAMLHEILVRPWQLSALLRIAADAYAARVALIRLRRMVGPGFSCTQSGAAARSAIASAAK
jgi:hopanoid-associated phosphorylase